MAYIARMLFLISLSLFISVPVFSAPIGRKNKISFDKSLPEDISNENFPDVIESFDYPNASILDLVKAIGKLTGLNFIIDPGLQGKKITISAPSKITVAEAYKAFLSSLAINGYTLVKSGAFWKIQETKKALKDNTEIYSGDYFPNTDQLITRIIKLKHIDAKEFSNSIKYLLSQSNQISSHESSNSIIISDYGSVIERIMKIVYTMDVSGSKDRVRVIPVEHASAGDLADMLNQLLSVKRPSSKRASRRSLVQKSDNQSYIKISSILADERTNSLVVSANDGGHERVTELVKELDTYVDPSRTGGIYVYNVLYGTAEQVYNTLMGIQGSSSKGKKSGSLSSFGFGGFSGRSRGATGRNNKSSSSSPLFENVTILADINTNSLIISAKNKYDFERVKQVLKKIDVPRDQVFVQAVIVEMLVDQGDQWEVNLASALTEGVKDFLGLSSINSTPIAGFLNRSFSADQNILQNSRLGPGLVFGLPLLNVLKSIGIDPSGSSGGSQAIQDLIGSDTFKNLSPDSQRAAISSLGSSNSTSQALSQALKFSVMPLLQILKKAGNVNVLSTPQITALDNITASIEVGENAPVGLTSTASNVALSQNSVEREDVTLKLEITPRINPDSGTIQMDISQKFDDFSERQSTASELQNKGVHIVKRNIETKMVLHDGETAVLGGLLTDKETRSENKVPVLGDIPVLGWLFKGSTVKKEKRNLVVFITPTIIRGETQRRQTKKLLGKKLDERIDFVKKYMKGRDPHGEHLKKMISSGSFPDEKPSAPESVWEDTSSSDFESESFEPLDEKNTPPQSLQKKESSEYSLPPLQEIQLDIDEDAPQETSSDEETSTIDLDIPSSGTVSDDEPLFPEEDIETEENEEDDDDEESEEDDEEALLFPLDDTEDVEDQ